MLPNVNITVNRSGLGLVDFTNDGIMGMITFGAAVTGKLELNDPFVIYSIADAQAKGITEALNPHAWKQVKEFYNECGNGTKLWMIVTGSGLMSSTVSGSACIARKLIEAARGEICLCGISVGTFLTPTAQVDGIDGDVVLTVSQAQILADEYQALIMPLSFVIDGAGFLGNENVLADLHTMKYHRGSVLLAASENDGVASVGQFLGRLAAIPVQRKVSRVKDGALKNLKGFLTDGAPVDDRANALNVLHDKGYIVYRTFPGKTGYYYSGDPTATANTDDLNTIARNRIIDKVFKITYKTYVEELDDDVPVTQDGKLQPAVCGYLKSMIELQVNSQMNEEISNFIAIINPDQNILSGVPLQIELQITPMGYLSPINVKLGFINPFLNQ